MDETVLRKQAEAGAFPTRMMGKFVPVGSRRELEPDEEADVARGESQWYSPIIHSDAQPISELLASPGRQALAMGLVGAGAGGAGGYYAGQKMGLNPTLSALVGAAGIGLPVALSRYVSRWKQNEHLKEVMRRLPPGATRRDLSAESMLADALAHRFGEEKLGADKQAGVLGESVRAGLPVLAGGLGGAALGMAGQHGLKNVLPSAIANLLPMIGAAAGGTAGSVYSSHNVVRRGRKQLDELRAKKVLTEQEARDKAELEELHMHKASAEGPYGMDSMAVQQYAPIHNKRELSSEEQKDVDQGQSQWLPKIFQSYATPLPQMMASPGRQAILAGLAGGLGGAYGGGMIGGALGSPGVGAAIGGVGLGGLSALMQYMNRNAENENILDIMKRLPRGATKRDYLADPAVQADANRDALSSAAEMAAGGMGVSKYAADVSGIWPAIRQYLAYNWPTMAAAGLGGAGIGAAHGALTGKGALRGAVLGGGLGAGAGAGMMGGMQLAGETGLPETMGEWGLPLGLGVGALGAAAGGTLGRNMAEYVAPEEEKIGAYSEKSALTVERGRFPSRATANTIGRVGNTLSIIPPVISLKTYENPDEGESREVAEDMERGAPQELKDTKLRLGGTDAIDDMLWKKNAAGLLRSDPNDPRPLAQRAAGSFQGQPLAAKTQAQGLMPLQQQKQMGVPNRQPLAIDAMNHGPQFMPLRGGRLNTTNANPINMTPAMLRTTGQNLGVRAGGSYSNPIPQATQ